MILFDFISKEKIYKPFWFWSVLIARLITPVLFFYNSLFAILIFFFLDNFDEQVWSRTSSFKGLKYHLLDKMIDIPGYTLMLLSTLSNHYFFPLFVLFSFRLIGVLAFLINQNKRSLIFFPNFFEFFWIWAVLLPILFPWIHLTSTRGLVILGGLLILKVFHEFVIHFFGGFIFPYFRKRFSTIVSLLDDLIK